MIIFQIFNLQSFSSDPDLCLLAHPQLSKTSDNTENLHKPSCVFTLDTIIQGLLYRGLYHMTSL